MLQEATIEGNKLFGELDEHTPPDIAKKMEDEGGGRLMPGQIMVGLESMKASIKVIGVGIDVLKAYGAKAGLFVQIDVKESQQDKAGKAYALHYSYTGEITSIKEDPAKMGSKPGCTIEFVPSVYKKTENGTVMYNINTETQEIDLGQGDIMADHRRNIGRS
jgi:hypothetical protein